MMKQKRRHYRRGLAMKDRLLQLREQLQEAWADAEAAAYWEERATQRAREAEWRANEAERRAREAEWEAEAARWGRKW